MLSIIYDVYKFANTIYLFQKPISSPNHSDTEVIMCTHKGQQAKANSKAPFSVKHIVHIEMYCTKIKTYKQMDIQVIVNLTGLAKRHYITAYYSTVFSAVWTYPMSK